MKSQFIIASLLVFCPFGLCPRLSAQSESNAVSLQAATSDLKSQLEQGEAELSAIREHILSETLPLSRELNSLQAELQKTKDDYQQVIRVLDGRQLDLSNLRNEVKLRTDEKDYLSGLLADYLRSFDARLHVAENQLYGDTIQEGLLAPENTNLSEDETFETQLAAVDLSLQRLEKSVQSASFDGKAVCVDGIVRNGTFVLVGPLAIFRSQDGDHVGMVERRIDSLQPIVVPFGDPADGLAAASLVKDGSGYFPFDVTLGNAHKMEATEEPFLEHVKKGGAVMIPIGLMAAVALLVSLYKWVYLALQGAVSSRKLETLRACLQDGDRARAKETVDSMRGPVGEMLKVGMAHLDEPRELIEESMFETVLKSRLRLNSQLPFIAICAASAPLLGLLGTVTGIINTFKLITVFGSGDVKSLSGGISEALITTKFGLIVAIPALLIHAFLTRKAKNLSSQMETTALSFVNQVSSGRLSEGSDREGVMAGGPESPDSGSDTIQEQIRVLLENAVAAQVHPGQVLPASNTEAPIVSA